MKNLLFNLKELVDIISISDIIFLLLVLILIILIVTMFYIFKLGQEYVYVEKEKKTNENYKPFVENPDNLIEVANALEENNSSLNINNNSYEEEQEENAIISYDELIKNADKFSIQYDDEEDYDGIKVRKIDLEPFNFKIEEPSDIAKVKVISYEKEEAFLEALKTLQKNLI